MILCLGTTPAVQRVMIFRRLVVDAVNRAVTTLEGAAGKSINVAKVLRTLGEEPVATGFLGGEPGAFISSLLEKRGVERDFVPVAARTRECITVIDEFAGTHTELVEESSPVVEADYQKLLEVVRKRLESCQALIMSGSLTPGCSADLYFQYTGVARKAGVLPVVDAQGPPLVEALKAGPALVKPNRAELAATVQQELPDDAAVMRGMRHLHERGAERVIVTAGKDPALAFDGKSFWRIPTPKITVLNPIGSGDAFTAALVSRLLRGDDLGEACRWASAAGAANALTLMPGELNLEDVQRLAQEVKVHHIAQQPSFPHFCEPR